MNAQSSAILGRKTGLELAMDLESVPVIIQTLRIVTLKCVLTGIHGMNGFLVQNRVAKEFEIEKDLVSEKELAKGLEMNYLNAPMDHVQAGPLGEPGNLVRCHAMEGSG